ncbi:MAG: UPF0175 family protein [Ignavibacteria bacterium]|jgi:predicted HTH domain antitoxin|nr:UPF0175 family protein [Ignavibacteria bacterium]
MNTLTINVPEMLDIDAREISMLIGSKLYEQGKLSLGQAADVAGLSKRTFAEMLYHYDTPLFNYPASDIIMDVANA